MIKRCRLVTRNSGGIGTGASYELTAEATCAAKPTGIGDVRRAVYLFYWYQRNKKLLWGWSANFCVGRSLYPRLRLVWESSAVLDTVKMAHVPTRARSCQKNVHTPNFGFYKQL